MVDKLDANSFVVYFFRLVCRCDNADPAALFDATLVLPSRSTFDALDAAPDEVTLLGAATCDSALPAAVFEFLPVEPFAKTCEALWAAFGPVTLLFMVYPRVDHLLSTTCTASIAQSSYQNLKFRLIIAEALRDDKRIW